MKLLIAGFVAGLIVGIGTGLIASPMLKHHGKHVVVRKELRK